MMDDLLEGEIQKQIIDYLKSIDALVFRMNAGKGRHNMHLAPKGTPDLMAITKQGETVWIEVKTKTGTVSNDQKNMFADLRSRKQVAIVVRSLDAVKYFMERIC